MSLRSLGSLLIRRSSPRGICRVRAQAETRSASGSPARSLHTLRELDTGGGAVGALFAGGFATLAGILYFSKDGSDESARGLISRKGDLLLDEAIKAKFMDEDGKFAWLEYLDYINFRSKHPEVTDPEVLDKISRTRYTVSDDKEAVNQEIGPQEGMRIDEEAMKERFEDWMKEYDKTYHSEEEKARRYGIFKKKVMRMDKMNASFPSGDHLHLAPNNLGDCTEEELDSLGDHQGDFNWEAYFSRMSKMYAEGRVYGAPGYVGVHREVECTEAAKQRFKELTARKAEQDARKAEQGAREAVPAARKSQ